MKIDKIEKNGVAIASVTGDEIVIKDTASAFGAFDDCQI